ncbi:hypothetical protein H632_c2181p0 [Helicosporidium sp. ATCC 50920]|nr:hypothetical protein H632_c2181p0 [Helicosporidium sp. ATCC 50920]|eukprot:KDD73434.1 hypothetical protein H632_c2181p0 [Helicosporidium sp. ATCC 50920]
MKNEDLRRALMDYQIAPDYMLTSGQLTSATEIPTLAKNQQLRVDIVPKPRTVFFLGAQGYPNVKALVENIIVCDIVAYIVDSVPISEQADKLLTKAGLVPAG